MFRKWLHGLLVGLLIGAVFVAVPGAQTYIWSSINGVPYAPGAMIGRLSLGPGASGSPSITFAGDPDTGFYSAYANSVSLQTAGTTVWQATDGLFYFYRLTQFGASNSTGGTDLYINPVVKTSNDLLLLAVNGSVKFGVDYAGEIKVASGANGADCTSATAVTTVNGIVTVCSEPVPDPLTQTEINELRGLLMQTRQRQ
jgi:hypothetical protein